MDPRDYLNILHMAERLKDTIRHCTTSKRREESVAEHSWRVSLMAFLLKDEFPDVNMDKVVDMCLIHDLGECFTGDIPAFVKTDSDREVEDSLLDEWVGSLPKEVSENMSSLYKEMDAQITKEAKIYKALDKLEALIQHNESPIDTWSENEYELNKTYAFDTVAFSKWLTDLRNEILNDTIQKIDNEKTDISDLLNNLDRLHSTKMGIERIKKNLELNEDVVDFCRQKIMSKSALVKREGKNWYILSGDCMITVNANSYTIITAHRK